MRRTAVGLPRAPAVRRRTLPWLALGVLVHPALLLGGLVYLRAAERHEREFTELVERS